MQKKAPAPKEHRPRIDSEQISECLRGGCKLIIRFGDKTIAGTRKRSRPGAFFDIKDLL